MQKKFLIIFMSAIILISTILQPMQASASESDSQVDTLENGYIEAFEDEFGNITELEYLIDEEEFRVNTYFNGNLVDYSTRQVDNGVYSDEIMYNQVLEVEQFPTQEPSFTRVKNLIVYDVNDLIKEIPVTEGPPLETPDLNDFPVNDVIKGPRGPISTSSVTSSNVTLPGPYNLALYKCNTVLNQCGTLYKRSDTAQVNKFMFDFAKDVAISVIATTITIVFSAKIVAVGVLLSQLGVQFSNLMLKDSLTGYYSATRYRYSYYVMVKSKTTYRHNQVQYNVRYYNQKNRKELTRVVRSPSWMSENAILNVGILAY